MQNILFCLLGFLLMCAIACERSSPPEELISVDEMIVILKEYHMGEGSIGQMRLSGEQRDTMRIQLYDKVLEKYEMDRETFYSSYEYYLTQPTLMDTIYTRIIDQLNKQLPEEQAKRARQK